MDRDTKQSGDIAEQFIILQALKLGWGVLRPIGDRLSYDLVLDVDGVLVKVQAKFAWLDKSSLNFQTDSRKTKTNRRVMLRDGYKSGDFDFAIVFIEPLNVCYVFPLDDFVSFASTISLVEAPRRLREPKSRRFRNAWNLIQEWATSKVISTGNAAKVGEAGEMVIPNQTR